MKTLAFLIFCVISTVDCSLCSFFCTTGSNIFCNNICNNVIEDNFSVLLKQHLNDQERKYQIQLTTLEDHVNEQKKELKELKQINKASNALLTMMNPCTTDLHECILSKQALEKNLTQTYILQKNLTVSIQRHKKKCQLQLNFTRTLHTNFTRNESLYTQFRWFRRGFLQGVVSILVFFKVIHMFK